MVFWEGGPEGEPGHRQAHSHGHQRGSSRGSSYKLARRLVLQMSPLSFFVAVADGLQRRSRLGCGRAAEGRGLRVVKGSAKRDGHGQARRRT